MSDRTPRQATSRDSESRTLTWKPPETLPSPEPQEGWKFGWIRTATLGETDVINVSMKRREGWEFIKASDMPDFAELAGFSPTSSDRMEIGGLALAKIPTEIWNARAAYYQRMTDQQMEAVDEQLLSNNDPRMPLMRQRSSKTSRSLRE